MNIIFGIIAIVFGFVIVWKADWMMENFGRIAWADEHLGSEGGTRMFYKLIGLAIIAFAFLFMFGIAYLGKPRTNCYLERLAIRRQRNLYLFLVGH